MQREALKYIIDINLLIDELELMLQECNGDFHTFLQSITIKRAVERNLEIIGEALKRANKIEPEIEISHTKEIIGLRNILAHNYDNIDPEILWAILIKHLPLLKNEIKVLIEKEN